MKIMADKGVPASMVDFIVAEDADDTMANIRLFEKEIQKSCIRGSKEAFSRERAKGGNYCRRDY